MPSLFSTHAVDAAFNRLHLLQSDTPAKWGTMNATSMVLHCRVVTESMMRQQPAAVAPSLKQRIIRTLILNGVVRIPQGRPMPKQIADQMAGAGVVEFEQERKALMDALNQFASFKGVMNGAHPSFGRMTHQQWGRFAWIHLDHHLRQFGV